MRFNALLLVVLFVAAACTHFDMVRPQHVYQATATARAQVAELARAAPPVTPIAPNVVPDATAMAIEVEEEAQVACDIKANVGSSGKIYHMPDGVYYSRVKIDTSQGDFYACTEQEAIDAGFRKSER
jgi:micrococcal nuclease